MTEDQLKGRGTKGRSWYASSGESFIYSFAFKDRYNICHNTSFTTDIASFVSRVVLSCFNISLSIEWPNDLILNQKKCGGILSEHFTALGDPWCVVGIGLNVNCETFPIYLKHSATSFTHETGVVYDVHAILTPLTNQLLSYVNDPSEFNATLHIS